VARAYTADLANDLGNLLQRTTSMMHRYRDGVIPTPTPGLISPLQTTAEQLPAVLHRAFGEGWDPRVGLEAVFNLVGTANRFVENTKPWALARAKGGDDMGASQRLDHVLWNLAECLRLVAEALRPFLPETAERIAMHLGVTLAANWTEGLQWGALPAGGQVGVPGSLFPKRETPRESA
jgi:methionyl-tRNA synthetase